MQKAVILFEESQFASSTKFLSVYSIRCPSEIRISSCLVYKYIEELLKKGKKLYLKKIEVIRMVCDYNRLFCNCKNMNSTSTDNVLQFSIHFYQIHSIMYEPCNKNIRLLIKSWKRLLIKYFFIVFTKGKLTLLM